MGRQRIDSLTDAEREAMAPWADQWIEKALAPDPADHAYVEEGMRKCYEHADLTWHGRVIWVQSPLDVAFIAPSIAHLIEDQNVAVEDAIRRVVDEGERFPDAVAQNWSRYLGGSMWSSWSAYTSFYRDVLDLDLPGDLWDRDAAYAQAQTAGWWWPHTEFVVVSERHVEIHRDPQGRLHNTNGPAIRWPNGWGIWSLEGITVPQWAVENPDISRIMRDLSNTEQRRVAIANYGWGKVVGDLSLKVIDHHQDPKMGTLYELPDTLVDRPGQATLLVAENASPDMDGTYRKYGLLASGTARTVLEAQASLARMTVEQFLALDGAS